MSVSLLLKLLQMAATFSLSHVATSSKNSYTQRTRSKSFLDAGIGLDIDSFIQVIMHAIVSTIRD